MVIIMRRPLFPALLHLSSIAAAALTTQQEAIERGSIRCDGKRPDFHILHHPEWDDEGISAQVICAKPEYGGSLTGMHGYCLQADEFDSRWPVAAIAFEENVPVGALAHRIELSAHIALYCQTVCYCDKWRPVSPGQTTNIAIKPKGFAKRLDVFASLPRQDKVLQLHVNVAPLRSPQTHIKWSWDLQSVDTNSINNQYFTDILIGNQLREIRSLWQGKTLHMTMAPQNDITCQEVPFPPNLHIPPPYARRDYGNSRTLRICAAALNGGNPGANAGGFCYQAEDGFHVGFSMSFVPRDEWREVSFRFLLQQYCRAACTCTYERTAPESDMEGTDLDVDSPRFRLPIAVLQPDGNMGLGYERTSTGRRYPDSDSGDSSNCPMDSTNCPVTDITASNSPTCGATCNGPAARSCAGNSARPKECQCIYLTDTLTRTLGMDPVSMSGLAICLVSSYVQSKLNGVRASSQIVEASQRRGRLNGRSLKELPKIEMNCMCNSTFASPSCCGSDDGMIWDDRGLRLNL